VTTPNNENTLRIINLADPSIAPITYDAASRGDVISAMTFTPDSQALLFVEGSESSNRDGDNSLFSLNLSEGTASRIARGLFGPEIIVSPDGSTIAATDVQVPDDNREPTFSNLVEIALDGAKTPLIEGGEITDGKVNNQQFIYPLAWRPA
jgi:Tol biopolymer transport system component